MKCTVITRFKSIHTWNTYWHNCHFLLKEIFLSEDIMSNIYGIFYFSLFSPPYLRPLPFLTINCLYFMSLFVLLHGYMFNCCFCFVQCRVSILKYIVDIWSQSLNFLLEHTFHKITGWLPTISNLRNKPKKLQLRLFMKPRVYETSEVLQDWEFGRF